MSTRHQAETIRLSVKPEECDPNVAFYRSLGWEVAVTGLNRCELV